jgi:hypothetical protein
MWPFKRRTDTVKFKVVKVVGPARRVYHLTVPATFTVDEIEQMLVIMGAVEPRIEISGTLTDLDARP